MCMLNGSVVFTQTKKSLLHSVRLAADAFGSSSRRMHGLALSFFGGTLVVLSLLALPLHMSLSCGGMLPTPLRVLS